MSAFKGIPWDQRRKEISRIFPSVGLDWKKAFDQDIDLAGRILRDVLKSDLTVPGKPGPRPNLDRSQVEPIVDQWLGRDPKDRPYTNLRYKEALVLLSVGKSLTQVSRKIGLSRTQTYRLLKGEIEPDIDMVMKTAEAYDKKPSYFLEYRVAAIAAQVLKQLEENPEVTVRYFESLFR